jgi:YegS/Rv2252/BmrU family lipid kinase
VDDVLADLSRECAEIKAALPKSLSELADTVQASAGKFECVVAAGGDGTLHQVVRSADLMRQVVGILPLGSGNDFARNVRYPKGLKARAAHLLTLQPAPVDVATLNGRRYVNSGGFGVDATTLVLREELKGKIATNYIAVFLLALGRLETIEAEVIWDEGRLSGRWMWVLAMNNVHIGNGIPIAPRAKIDDGKLDVLLVKAVPKVKLLVEWPLVLAGKHESLADMRTFQTTALTVRSRKPVKTAACDGEIVPLGESEVRFEVLPRAMRFLTVPSESR